MAAVRVLDSLIKLYLLVHAPIGLLLDSQSGELLPAAADLLDLHPGLTQ